MTAIEKLDPNFASLDPDSATRWYDAELLPLEGRGFDDVATRYDRLPASAQGVVRPDVWELSQCSTGMAVHFVTDATAISVKWTLRRENLAMHHMPATGVSGIDLYGRLDGRWRYAGTASPQGFPDNQVKLADGLDGQTRAYRLYLPLYNGVTQVSVGVPEGASISAPASISGDGDPRPIVFYGTSIVQGGCASRPGMVHSSIVGRRLDMPVVNLGFSGNGRSEPEVADLLARIDARAFVIDPLPNMSIDLIHQNLGPLVKKLRAAWPQTPIILTENIPPQHMAFRPAGYDGFRAKNRALAQVIAGLQGDGVTGLCLVGAYELFGEDGEATVDGVHATDLGYVRMAEAFYQRLRPLLG